MDMEFHYYITYLIAARAGFDPHAALVVLPGNQATSLTYWARNSTGLK